MSDERLVMALLAEGNPATEFGDDARTDVSAPAYLAAIELRSSEMTGVDTKASPEERRRFPTKPWLVAALAVVLVGVAAIVMNTVSSDSPLAGAPAIPLDGAEDDPQAVEAFQAVEAAYQLYDKGDPAWVEVRSRGSLGTLEGAELAEQIATFQAGLAAEPRIEVSGCVSNGLGEWPGIVDSGVPTPNGYFFRCQAVEENDFYTALGLEVRSTYVWVVADGEILAVRSEEQPSTRDPHIAAYRDWLEQAHPEAVPEQFGDDPEAFLDPVGIAAALDYVDEFLAQSDTYPIGDAG